MADVTPNVSFGIWTLWGHLFRISVDCRIKRHFNENSNHFISMEKAVRELIEVTFMSLDGVIDSPTIVHETQPYWVSDPEYQEDSREVLFGADALLLGRKTYEHFAEAYPKMASAKPEIPNEFIDRMNSLPKYVASTTLKETTWNATLLSGDIAAAVLKLKQQPGRYIVKYGTGVLDRTLLEHNLIDTLRIYLFPVAMGAGSHLLEELASPRHFELSEVAKLSTGTLILKYHSKT